MNSSQHTQNTILLHLQTFIVKKSGAPLKLVKYHKQPATDYSRTDFEASAANIDANPETDIDIPELDIALKSIPIIAKTRKLKAVWTPELSSRLKHITQLTQKQN